jgi:hypothetical protein
MRRQASCRDGCWASRVWHCGRTRPCQAGVSAADVTTSATWFEILIISAVSIQVHAMACWPRVVPPAPTTSAFLRSSSASRARTFRKGMSRDELSSRHRHVPSQLHTQDAVHEQRWGARTVIYLIFCAHTHTHTHTHRLCVVHLHNSTMSFHSASSAKAALSSANI